MGGLLQRLTGASSFITGLDEDVLFDLLRSSRRREVITHLSDHEGPLELGELAEAIAFIESDDSVERVEDVSDRRRKALWVSLQQSHIPLLERRGIVHWDGSDPIEPTDTCENLARIIREVRRMNGNGSDEDAE